MKPKRLEDAGKFGGQRRVKCPGKFVLGDLEADDLSMMAHAELAKAERTQSILALLDCRQGFAGDRAAVFDARGEAGRGGLVPNAKSCRLGERADVLFRQASVEERCRDVVLAGSSNTYLMKGSQEKKKMATYC